MSTMPDFATPAIPTRSAPDVQSDDASSPYAWIEALLAKYPDLTANELDRLVHWFEREASAREVGLLASEPRIEQQYRRFREEHVDPLTLKDVGWAAVVVAILAFATLAVAWLMP